MNATVWGRRFGKSRATSEIIESVAAVQTLLDTSTYSNVHVTPLTIESVRAAHRALFRPLRRPRRGRPPVECKKVRMLNARQRAGWR